MKNQFVKIPMEGDWVTIFCPVCGTSIYEEEKTDKICKHVLFTYQTLEDEGFDYIRDDLNKLQEEVQKFKEEHPRISVVKHFVKKFLTPINNSSLLCLELEYQGYGPMPSYSVFICVDFENNK